MSDKIVDINNLPYNDEKTWMLLQSGYTRGVFQCESRLVQTWLKRIKPNKISDLADCISIVRPGPLDSGLADLYVKNKSKGIDKDSFGHPIIDNILNSTYGTLIFQESLLKLGSDLAWKHLSLNERLLKADILRKGVGKKDSKKLLEISQDFKEGCLKNNIDEKIIDRLLDIIKKCGKYLFNASHAYAYAHVAYKTAYLKCHYPYEFIATYLSYADEKGDKWQEISDIVSESRVLGIDVFPPNINLKNKRFVIGNKNNKKCLYFGLSNIKFVNNKLVDLIKDKPLITNWKQFIYLAFTDLFGDKINSRTAEALIVTGAFSDIGLSRKVLLNLVTFFRALSDKELEFVLNNIIISSCIK